jgi:fatty-acyl-CoA synthase
VREIPAWVEYWASRADADRPALEFNGRTMTYLQLRSEMLARASRFVGADVPVVVSEPDPLEAVTWTLAVLAAGESPILLSAHHPRATVATVMSLVDAAELTDFPEREGLRCAVDVPAGSEGILLTTSGSTGVPKVVRRGRDGDAAACLTNPLRGWPITYGSRFWMPTPVESAGLLNLVLATLVVGGTVVLDRFDASAAGEFVRERRIDGTYFVPTMLRLALGTADFDPYDWRGLSMMFWGGEPMDESTDKQVVEAMGDIVHCGYGSTEVPLSAAASPAMRRAAPGTCGAATPFHALRVVDSEGLPVGPGVPGEIETSGFDGYRGYWGGDEVQPGDWFRTGDVGVLDERGLLFVDGRRSSVVNIGGNRVSPQETAEAIRRLPEVSQAAVVAVQDEVWGNRLHAFVVPAFGAVVDRDWILAQLRGQLARYKLPRGISVVAALPLDASGKLSTARLEALARDAASPSCGET